MNVAVVGGIGINEAADGAMLGGNLGLDAAPGIPVARDYDCALDGDAHAVEFFVVIRDAVVDVNQRSGDVAVGGVGVIGGQLFGLLVGSGIDGQHRFLEFGGEFRGFDQFDDSNFWSGKENVETFDVGVQAPFLEFGEHPLGIVFVIGRADVVRASGEALHVVALVLGLGYGAELGFPIALGARRSCGITVQRLLGFRGCGQKQEAGKNE